MKKSKLIEMLSKIEGDPDILFWNGYVGDHQDIDNQLVDSQLFKMTLSMYIKSIMYERRQERNDNSYELSEAEIEDIKKSYKKYIDWESNQFISPEQLGKHMYKGKKVYMMQTKMRGKRACQRANSMEY